VYEKLQERERLGSTGLGGGIALPHARMEGLENARGAFLNLAEPVAFDAVDGRPVDLVFGLLVPQSATEQHLQLLAALARLFHDKSFCDGLRKAEDPAAVLAHFLAREQNLRISPCPTR
jgi:nitrogen PTS system EIIA component